MIKKIARKSFLEKYPNFPTVSPYRNRYFFPETYDSYILYADAKSAVSLCRSLTKELSKLIQVLNFDHLSCLGDANIPWLFRDHDYKPVKEGLDYLVQKKVSKSFSGALKVDVVDLPDFLRHIFWLVRCNGVVFIPHFSDSEFNVLISICQYGNIHFSTLNKEADIVFNEAILQTELYIPDDNKCRGFKIAHRKSTNR
ncbi:hypothetical protein [Mucilaginibacter sp. NFX135]|uniref:hypothetical protein n=1 Tax=Mucilaginibacter sp. NFX135 TaxID=3402687 RepID=UPI003AFA9426